jgi:precorrin-4 methylase
MAPSTPVAIVVDASLATGETHYTTLDHLPAIAGRDIRGAALLLVGPQFRARQMGASAAPLDDRALAARA